MLTFLWFAIAICLPLRLSLAFIIITAIAMLNMH